MLATSATFVLTLTGSPQLPSKPSRKKPPEGRLPKTKARTIFAPYYIVAGDYNSILGLNNSTQFPLAVNPTLYSEDGIGMPMPTVQLDPHQHVQVDLSMWVNQLGKKFSKGSLQLDFNSVNNGLVAQVMVMNERESLMFDVPFRARTEFKSSTLEAIWWAPDRDADMKVYVANTKDTAMRASLAVTDTRGNVIKRVALPLQARQLREVNLRDIIARGSNGVGGVSVVHEGKNGAVMAEGFIVVPGKGFSGNLAFQDTTMFGGTTLHGSGVFMESGFTGTLLLRNTSAENVSASPILRRGGHELKLGELIIPPGASKKLEVTTGLAEAEGYGIGIEVEHSGSPGALIGHWFSVDASGNMVVETPIRNPGKFTPGSGSNPFMLTDDFESVLFVKNTGEEVASFVGVIFHGREKYMLGAKFVEPGKTMAVDVRKLRDRQVLDAFGKVLPLDLDSGQFQWLRRSGPKMTGRMMILSRSKRISTNMSCPQCPCQPGESYFDVSPSFILGPVGGITQVASTQSDVSCDFYVNTYPIDPSSLIWSSTNSTVASVNTSGNVTCQSPGNSTVCGGEDVSVEVEQDVEDCENGDCYVECTSEDHFEQDCSEVQVITIKQDRRLWFFGNSIFAPPGFSLGGTDAALTVEGATTGTFKWTVTNGTSKLAFENGTTTITKTNENTVDIFSASYSTAANDVTVRLEYTRPSGGQTQTFTRTLDIDSPYKLESNGSTTHVSAIDCVSSASGTNGFQSRVPYRIRSFFGVLITNIGVNETFGDRTDIYAGNNWDRPAGGFLSPSGTFDDFHCFTGPWTPHPLRPQSPLSTTRIFEQDQNWFVGSTSPSQGLPVQTNVQVFYIDHGEHKTVVSPVR